MAKAKKEDYIEITPGMRSFAFLRLQGAVIHVHDLLGSAALYNEFPHTIKNEIFFEFAYSSYRENKYRSPFEESVTAGAICANVRWNRLRYPAP